MSEIKVNSIKGVGASAAAITVNNSDGTCTANITNRSNRNLIINGAMKVAQRGTSSTTSNTYSTVDRFQVRTSGVDEEPTQAQADVASGTTPFTLGFRKAFKITNGNQTSGAGTSDYIWFEHRLESQDIASSGWNYTSSSSFITFSFWIKSSVAQTFKGYFRVIDGTTYQYPFETGSLSADTWTKVTKIVPGNSNISFDNDENFGFQINIFPFYGTDVTDNSVTENAWAAFASSARMKDNTSTWYTTNDATLEITGVQLEVGSVATDFEHLSFADELRRCQRYLYTAYQGSDYSYITGPNDQAIGAGFAYSSGEINLIVHFPVQLRNTPTISQGNSDYGIVIRRNGGVRYIDASGWAGSDYKGRQTARMYNTAFTNHGNITEGSSYTLHGNSGDVYLRFDAEL